MAYDPIPFVDSAGVAVWSAKVAGDSNNRMEISADGIVSWGGGSGAVDVVLSRGGANQLDLAAGDSLHLLGGHLDITENVQTSGTPKVLLVTGAAHTNMTLSTEVVGVDFDQSATKQWAAGPITVQREFLFQAPTYAFVAGSTVTDAATFAITGPPIVGPNATFTNEWPLWVQSGMARFSSENTGNIPTGLGGVDDVALFHHAFNTFDNAYIYIISGTAANSQIRFGDPDNAAQGVIDYDNNTNIMSIESTIDIGVVGGFQSIVLNDSGIDQDLRAEGDTMTHMLYLEGNGASENIALLAASLPAWQSMDRGLFIGDATTIPTGNPTAGAFMYVSSGVVNIRQSDGTTFAIAAGGGNTLDGAYDQGGAGAGRTINATNGAVVMNIDGGSLPSISASTGLVIVNSSGSFDEPQLSLIGGVSGAPSIFFGDTTNEDVGIIRYNNFGVAGMEFSVAASEEQLTLLEGTGVVINTAGAALDFRVEGDTMAWMFFCEGNAASENIAFLTTTAPNWQSMDRGWFVGDVTTAPTAVATAGVFVWSASGVLTTNGALAVQEPNDGGDVKIKTVTTELTGLTGASVTATNLIPAGCFLIGVTTRVTTTITGATTFDIGDGTDVDLWGAAIALTAGTTTDKSDETASGDGSFAAAANVVLTANGSSFTAGAVRITLMYLELFAPTS